MVWERISSALRLIRKRTSISLGTLNLHPTSVLEALSQVYDGPDEFPRGWARCDRLASSPQPFFRVTGHDFTLRGTGIQGSVMLSITTRGGSSFFGFYDSESWTSEITPSVLSQLENRHPTWLDEIIVTSGVGEPPGQNGPAGEPIEMVRENAPFTIHGTRHPNHYEWSEIREINPTGKPAATKVVKLAADFYPEGLDGISRIHVTGSLRQYLETHHADQVPLLAETLREGHAQFSISGKYPFLDHPAVLVVPKKSVIQPYGYLHEGTLTLDALETETSDQGFYAAFLDNPNSVPGLRTALVEEGIEIPKELTGEKSLKAVLTPGVFHHLFVTLRLHPAIVLDAFRGPFESSGGRDAGWAACENVLNANYPWWRLEGYGHTLRGRETEGTVVLQLVTPRRRNNVIRARKPRGTKPHRSGRTTEDCRAFSRIPGRHPYRIRWHKQHRST